MSAPKKRSRANLS